MGKDLRKKEIVMVVIHLKKKTLKSFLNSVKIVVDLLLVRKEFFDCF